ncbi:DUF3168 domain-containing protein [Paenochrobactrum sp. BZR 588]|uniref:DUF3168 domain-containing protein n=1 Tax=Paenochrobactrum TaxID=999488 RepID=UPI0035BBA053
MSASISLQKAIYDLLRNDADVSAKLGTNRILDHVPPTTGFPYITLGSSVVYDWSTDSEPGQEHLISLHIWAQSSGRKFVLEVIELIAQKLDHGTLELIGHVLVNLNLQEISAQNSDRRNAYQGIMRYRAVTEPQTV